MASCKYDATFVFINSFTKKWWTGNERKKIMNKATQYLKLYDEIKDLKATIKAKEALLLSMSADTMAEIATKPNPRLNTIRSQSMSLGENVDVHYVVKLVNSYGGDCRLTINSAHLNSQLRHVPQVEVDKLVTVGAFVRKITEKLTVA